MNIVKVGEFITQRRKELGYTQAELGEKVGVSDKAVSKWERGLSLPDTAIINRLAVELMTDVAALLAGEEPDFSSDYPSMQKNAVKEAEKSDIFEENVTVEIKDGGNVIVSPYLFGINLEHTRSDIVNGLSAQMIQNRKFVGKPNAASGHAVGWFPIGEKTFFVQSKPYTRHVTDHYHMNRRIECNAQRVVNFYDNTKAGIGQHELFLQKDTVYDFAIVLKTIKKVEITVSLTSRFGKEVYTSKTFIAENEDWERYTLELVSPVRDEDADICITFESEGCIDIGAVSLMPKDNFRGMRPDVIELLKKIGTKVIRWPGGDFAGEYCWFDGLMPVDMRAPFESALGITTQPHSMGYDFHEVNIDDFIALCREVGAQPMITLNLAWSTPEESAMWVEYCNGDETTEYGKKRIERGYKEPYNVYLWCLGNEFGCGHMEGDKTPYGYYKLAGSHLRAMKQVCKELTFLGSGPHPNIEWTRQANIPLSSDVSLTSLHFYAQERVYKDREFLEEDYYEGIKSVETARNTIRELRSYLNDNVKISFDEWNVWYAWYRPSCVTDGLFTALTTNMLISEAEKSGVSIACHFEAVNEGSIVVKPDYSALTATGQAFNVMKNHINGRVCYQSESVLATKNDGILTVTAINASYDKQKTVKINTIGKLQDAKLYYSENVLPHSVFEEKDAQVAYEKDAFVTEIPPHCMVQMIIKL